MTGPPAAGVGFEATFVSLRSTSGWTVIVAVAWLFAGLGSSSLPDTVARLPTAVPASAAVVRALIVTDDAVATRDRADVTRDGAVLVVASGGSVDEVQPGRQRVVDRHAGRVVRAGVVSRQRVLDLVVGAGIGARDGLGQRQVGLRVDDQRRVVGVVGWVEIGNAADRRRRSRCSGSSFPPRRP